MAQDNPREAAAMALRFVRRHTPIGAGVSQVRRILQQQVMVAKLGADGQPEAYVLEWRDVPEADE